MRCFIWVCAWFLVCWVVPLCSLLWPKGCIDLMTASTLSCHGWVELSLPLTTDRWCLSVSLCLAFVIAFSRFRSAYSCICSDKLREFNMPTTILSLMISIVRAPYSQCSTREYNDVIRQLTDSPLSCKSWLKLVDS